MKKIVINSRKHGVKEVLVDDEDYDDLMQWKWFVTKSYYADGFYAGRHVWDNGRKKIFQMHRHIMEVYDSKIVVDHKDHNTLNNQRSNLRPCSVKENGRNISSHKDASSKYLGVGKSTVSDRKSGRKYIYWSVNIKINGVKTYGGTFKFNEEGEILAAKW